MQMARKASAQRAQSQPPQPLQGMASPSHPPRPATPKASAPPPSEGEAAAGEGLSLSNPPAILTFFHVASMSPNTLVNDARSSHGFTCCLSSLCVHLQCVLLSFNPL